ncbi:copper chaperone for superoxide dismutase [Homalodisca vitripennis]|nr:copper chaperone for superoxide dismutase [Homalodisca vitripennis]KAG8293877.1 hypothetical protein J6590_007543 [Homalodisca vitripennis]
MASSKIEFAVNMTCQSCVSKIKNSLVSVDGVDNVDVDLQQKTVVVDTSLPSSVIQSHIESTGLRAILRGYGFQSGGEQHAAVAMLGGDTGYSYGKVKGVVRLVQLDNDHCVIDGTIDGLSPGRHGLHIHECGDISQGCGSVGEHFSLQNTRHGGPDDDPQNRHTGDLGNIEADESGRATFRLVDKVLKVWDVIGRSVVVTEGADDLGKGNSPNSLKDGNSGERLSCGIISRSAGLFENQKQICACDGVTIWDERDRPVVGAGRRVTQSSLCAYI